MRHKKSSATIGKSSRKRSIVKARGAMGLMSSTSMRGVVPKPKLRVPHVVEVRERLPLTHDDMAKIDEICAKPVELSSHLLEAMAIRNKSV